jgi:hypothetical protein
MYYGDLSSIVQLGVGLHVGSAVLQLYSELGMAPMERRIARIKTLFNLPADERPSVEIREQFERLEGRYQVLKIAIFRQYQWLMSVNSAVALILAILLIIITCKASDHITREFDWFIVISIALSVLPAPILLGFLWIEARRRMIFLSEEFDVIEERAIN